MIKTTVNILTIILSNNVNLIKFDASNRTRDNTRNLSRVVFVNLLVRIEEVKRKSVLIGQSSVTLF